MYWLGLNLLRLWGDKMTPTFCSGYMQWLTRVSYLVALTSFWHVLLKSLFSKDELAKLLSGNALKNYFYHYLCSRHVLKEASRSPEDICKTLYSSPTLIFSYSQSYPENEAPTLHLADILLYDRLEKLNEKWQRLSLDSSDFSLMTE